MHTDLNTEAAPASQKVGAVARLRNKVATFLAIVATFIVVPAGAASADTTYTPAPTGAETATGQGFADLKGFVTGTLGLALFGITIAVLGIVMGVKWLRKGAKAS